MKRLIILLALLALTLSGCRFAAVETGSVRVETPTATPLAKALSVETKN